MARTCCCEYPTCSNCEEGEGPRRFQVEITGLADKPLGCGECGLYNGTFVLEAHEATPCLWEYFFDGTVCCGKIGLLIQADFIGGYNLIVEIRTNNIYWPNCASFKKNYAAKPACKDIDADVPLDSATHNCDSSAATCHVTAL